VGIVFKLKIRKLDETYGDSKEQLITEFLQAIGFLGTDGPKAKKTMRSKTGILLFTKCLIPNPKKSWTTSEIAKELGVPLQAVYRHLQWLREVGFLTEDFPGKAEDPKTVRLWHYDLEKAWDGVENRARICLETYKEIIDNLNQTLKEAKNQIPDGIMPLEKDESLEIDLREIRIGDERSYEEDLGLLGRGIGLLSNHHYPYSESMPYKILDECFFQRPDRAWTAEEIAAWVETTRPTAYRHLNRLISLGLIERCRAADGGPPTSAFHLRYGSLKKAWQKIETEIELILNNYKKTISKIKEK
tara:strand:+ start:680 stop:1585 length:906 start_codon:yes stop_codon:yes gene_type:complete